MCIRDRAAAEAVKPGARIIATEEHADLPPHGEVTTVVNQSIGGMSVAVYAVRGAQTELVAEGFASALDLGAAPIPGVAEVPESAPAATEEVDAVRWDPTEETVEDRLALIVSESMGYDVSDLPRELPLIDLGLDSLMGMRIKNRVENDLSLIHI